MKRARSAQDGVTGRIRTKRVIDVLSKLIFTPNGFVAGLKNKLSTENRKLSSQ